MVLCFFSSIYFKVRKTEDVKKRVTIISGSEQEKIGMGEIVSCPRCKTCQHLPETSEDIVETELSSAIAAREPIPESIIRDQKAAKRTARLRQWLASISATFCMIAVGTVYGWITISLPYLTSEDNTTLKLTSDEAAWLVSVTIIGSTIGPFMGASIADCYGRRFCLLVCNGFFILGWSFVLLATKVEILYVSRVILGMGVGIAYTTCPMYLSEVASTEIRGALGTLTAVNVFTGSLFTCCIGLWVSYTTLSSILLILPMIFIVIFIWFPESPYYLMAVDRRKKAYRSISYFKGTTKRNELMAEMEYICKVLGRNSIKPSPNLNSQSWLDKMRLMKQPGNKKALCIVVGLTTAQQLSGNFNTMQYLELLFMKMKTIKSSVATIIILTVGLLSGTAATVMVEIFGRRALLIVSTLGLAITLGILTSYFALVQRIPDSSILDIVAVTDTIFYQLFYQLGLGTLTNVLIGELFPTEAKSIAGAIVIMFDGTFGFIVSKLYQVINDNVGPHITYTIFTICSAISFFMVHHFVPETKGKTHQEIRALLTGKKREDTDVVNAELGEQRPEERRTEIKSSEARTSREEGIEAGTSK